MSKKWISLIPKARRGTIWNPDEFSALLDVIGIAEKEFARQLLSGYKSITRKRGEKKGRELREKNKNVEKSKLRSPKSHDEDSSSKAKTEMKSTRFTGDKEYEMSDAGTIMLKGKPVDHNPNPERNVENRESGEKQKEKSPGVDNDSSRDETANKDMALVMPNDDENVLRERAKSAIKKKRSSLAAFRARRTTKAKDILEGMNVPEELTRLLSQSIFMKLKDIQPAVEDSLNNGLVECMIDKGDESKMISVVLCAVLRQLRQMGKEEKNSAGVLRAAIAGFFEVADEVSDIVLAGIFYSEAGDALWAAHLMFVFMGLSRFFQFVFFLAMGQSFLSAVEGLIGVKCITDTYRMIRDGPTATKGGQQLGALRAYSLGLGIICESFPQMMLQEFLRDEAWDLRYPGSDAWEIPELVGDIDAAHAGNIFYYRKCYQPWDKIEDWLNDKKVNHPIMETKVFGKSVREWALRIIVMIVAVPLLVLIINNDTYFKLLVILVTYQLTREFRKSIRDPLMHSLTQVDKKKNRKSTKVFSLASTWRFTVLCLVLPLVTCWGKDSSEATRNLSLALNTVILVNGLLHLLILYQYTSKNETKDPSILRQTLTSLLIECFGIVYLGWCLSHGILLKCMPDGYGIGYIWFGLGGIWMGDNGALVVGSIIGKRGPKLFRAVSPGKTAVGAISSILTCTTYCIMFAHFSKTHPEKHILPLNVEDSWLGWSTFAWVALLGLFLGLLGILGDLLESLMKRACEIKDSGAIIPGHGGLLDRLDSVLLVIPLFYWLCVFMSEK
eukprot:g2798.t1